MRISVFILFFLVSLMGQDSAFDLSNAQKEYLESKKSLKLCIDPDWMPFEKFDDRGNHIGISSDYFSIFEKKLGISVVAIKSKSWSETLELLEKRECDILSLGNATPKREKYLSFTRAYLNIPFVVVTKNHVTFIDDFKLLKNKKIGVVKNNALKEILVNKYPNFELVEVKDNSEGIQKLQNNEIFGYAANMLSIGYTLKKDFITELKILNKISGESSKLAIGVRNDEPELYEIFEKLIQTLDEEQHHKILNKYLAVNYQEGFNYEILWKILFVVFITYILFFYKQYMLKKAVKDLKNANKEIAKKNKELVRLSTTDTLTGLYNRAKLDEVLLYEIERAKRYDESFGVVLLDVDYFKKINDTYGHHKGDDVLIDFSNIIQKNIRGVDIAGRWGGEEFMIICPNTDKNGTISLSEHIRVLIEKFDFGLESFQSASFGVSIYENGDDDDSLIIRADKALYKAKHSGRNKVIYYEED